MARGSRPTTAPLIRPCGGETAGDSATGPRGAGSGRCGGSPSASSGGSWRRAGATARSPYGSPRAWPVLVVRTSLMCGQPLLRRPDRRRVDGGAGVLVGGGRRRRPRGSGSRSGCRRRWSGCCRVRGGLPRASWRTASSTAGSTTQVRGWACAARPRATAWWRAPVRRLRSHSSVSSIDPSEDAGDPAAQRGDEGDVLDACRWSAASCGTSGMKVRSRPAVIRPCTRRRPARGRRTSRRRAPTRRSSRAADAP